MKRILKTRNVNVMVKKLKINYDEDYLVNEIGDEIFDRQIEIDNDIKLYDLYKKQTNLLTSKDIKIIRNKYMLTQKDFSLIIGLGEISIHRFENGSIQTEGVDSIIRLANDPNNMLFLMNKNKKSISEATYKNLESVVKYYIDLKNHALANLELLKVLVTDFKIVNSNLIAQNIIKKYNEKMDLICQKYDLKPCYITNLKLQKLLYYVQGISLLLLNHESFSEKIMAWTYGPVVNEVYQNYKSNNNQEIMITKSVEKLSNGLNYIIDEVIDSYGNMEANKLIDFTHEEEPWQNTKINEEIKSSDILAYFKKVYNV